MARLDLQVVQYGFAPSRQRAKTLIQNGQILINGVICTKPSYPVTESDQITMQGEDIPFVGRGGLKLEYALQTAKISMNGRVCMDIGASTGGFTDCMLQHGAAKVYAIDVGHGQLAESLQCDSRVINWEGTDVRHLQPEQITEPITFFSVDVSFISLHHVLPCAAAFLEPGGLAVVLIKPQFEAGREHIRKNGLVLSPKVHEQVLLHKLQLFASLHLSVQTLCPSPIRGGSGNLEYLAVVQKTDTIFSVPDIALVVKQAFSTVKKEKAG